MSQDRSNLIGLKAKKRPHKEERIDKYIILYHQSADDVWSFPGSRALIWVTVVSENTS